MALSPTPAIKPSSMPWYRSLFKDELGQLAQREELPIHILRTGGPYDEAVDLSQSPLASRREASLFG
jgi:hypothetical protein